MTIGEKGASLVVDLCLCETFEFYPVSGQPNAMDDPALPDDPRARAEDIGLADSQRRVTGEAEPPFGDIDQAPEPNPLAVMTNLDRSLDGVPDIATTRMF